MGRGRRARADVKYGEVEWSDEEEDDEEEGDQGSDQVCAWWERGRGEGPAKEKGAMQGGSKGLTLHKGHQLQGRSFPQFPTRT